MPQFKEMGFTFNGEESRDKGFYIVNVTDSDQHENEIGLKKSIQEVDNNNITKTFTGIKYNEFSFTIDVMKMEQRPSKSEEDAIIYRPLPMTEDDIQELNIWLMKPNDYKQFISDQNTGIIYYVIFTEMREKVIGRYNYVTLTMRLNGGFAYSTTQYDTVHYVRGEETIPIETASTVDEYIYPDIEITMTGGTEVKIRNDNLNEEMILTGLVDGYTYICYNEGIKHIKCVEDEKANLRKNFNKVWLRLDGYAYNTLTVTGNCDIKIYFQNRLAIQH